MSGSIRMKTRLIIACNNPQMELRLKAFRVLAQQVKGKSIKW